MNRFNNTFENIYLLQRCVAKTFQAQFYKKGKMSDVLRFDYMGSAEFEFGAIPNAMKRMGETTYEFHKREFFLKSTALVTFHFYFPTTWNEKDRIGYFNQWQEILYDKRYLKERSSFQPYSFGLNANESKEQYCERVKDCVDFDILHGVFIFTNKKFKPMLPVALKNSVDSMIQVHKEKQNA